MPRLGSGVRIASPAPFGTEKAASSDAAFRFSEQALVIFDQNPLTGSQMRANPYSNL
ncbi:hypothetical protein SCH4B_1662 [Ruegeria sp. TrichCH4B]|nr:hypothetical protein SCH4B_1662 [Ruegeria sp. TrichCH4B]